VKVIGQGSFGKVYRAKLQDTNEVRAIKAIPKNKITDPE
jgi:serine/threonine protein kinase